MSAEYLIDKFTGRYFLAWVVTTILRIVNVIDNTTFQVITIAYITGGAVKSIADNIPKNNG